MNENYLTENQKDRPVLEASSEHIALALVLDVSGSMQGEKINSLIEAINSMIAWMKEDRRLKFIVDLAIFVFGEKGRENVLQGFCAIGECNPINLSATDSSTWVADSLNIAVDRLRERTEMYNKTGGAYKPWLVLVTDGEFFDSEEELNKVSQRIKQREKEGKLHFFGLGVEGYIKDQMMKFTEDPRKVMDVKASNFQEFFSWVGRSLATVSRTEVGTATTMEPLVFTMDS